MKKNLESGVLTKTKARHYDGKYGLGRSTNYMGTLLNDNAGNDVYLKLCKAFENSKLRVSRHGRGSRKKNHPQYRANSYGISVKHPSCEYFDVYVREMYDYEYKERQEFRKLQSFARDNGYSVSGLKETLKHYGLEIKPTN
jgi:hypothetical protein